MEYAQPPLLPPNPNNPNPYPYAYYPYYATANPTTLPQPLPPAAALTVEPSASLPPSGYEAYAYSHLVPYDQNHTVSGLSNLTSVHLRQAVQQFGTDPNAYPVATVGVGPVVASNGTCQLTVPNSMSLTVPNPMSTVLATPNSTFHGKNNRKKKRPNKIKVVVSAYCGICSVDCSSKGTLDQHKLGKKHKKKLNKLQPSNVAGPNNPLIGPLENPNAATTAGGGEQKSKRKSAQSIEDLEIKRRKVVEGGTAVDAVKTCTTCNVVCNSDTVFKYHLAGKKHASVLKKQAAATGPPANVQTQI